jgi:hypothetical protein
VTVDLAEFEAGVTGAGGSSARMAPVFFVWSDFLRQIKIQGDQARSKSFANVRGRAPDDCGCKAPAGCLRTRQMEASSLWQPS